MGTHSFYNWAALDRKTIARHFMRIFPMFEGRDLSIDKAHSYFAYNLKKLAPVKVTRNYDPTVGTGHMFVGGCYYSYHDIDNERCIEISFFYNNPKDKISMSNHALRKLSYYVADTLLHEIIHMRQYRRRAFKPLPDYNSKADKTEIRKEQAYLGCSDEIDAYSFNIACELMAKFRGNKNKVIQYLNKPLKNHSFKNSWRIYLKAFEYQHNHPIIRKVKKKVVYYLPAAELGKPYKTNDWINW